MNASPNEPSRRTLLSLAAAARRRHRPRRPARLHRLRRTPAARRRRRCSPGRLAEPAVVAGTRRRALDDRAGPARRQRPPRRAREQRPRPRTPADHRRHHVDRRPQRHPRRRRPVPLRTATTSAPSRCSPALTVDIPDHDLGAVNGYRRTLDLAQGLVTTFVRPLRRRRTGARSSPAAPTTSIVLHFTQSGGGTLHRHHHPDRHARRESADRRPTVVRRRPSPNGLRYGAAVKARGSGGKVRVDGTPDRLHRLRGPHRRGQRRHQLRARRRHRLPRPLPRPASGWPVRRSATRRVAVGGRPAAHPCRRLPRPVRAVRPLPRRVRRPSSATWTPGNGSRRAARDDVPDPGTGGRLPAVRPLPDDLRFARQPAR